MAASWLGWMFDGYEVYALVLVMAIAVRQLLPPERLPRASVYMGGLLAATLVGWAAGGVVAGVLADYIGRKRMRSRMTGKPETIDSSVGLVPTNAHLVSA
jgi:MFS family permease